MGTDGSLYLTVDVYCNSAIEIPHFELGIVIMHFLRTLVV